MQLEERDAALLWDMLEAGHKAARFILGKAFHEYQSDPLLQYAVERALEIVGEAASRVSPALREEHPEIPWRGMIGQRNVLIHEYGDIDHALVWSVVQEHLPKLLEQLEPLLPSPPAS
jgi:uncharacterized protein with HEPN domain